MTSNSKETGHLYRYPRDFNIHNGEQRGATSKALQNAENTKIALEVKGLIGFRAASQAVNGSNEKERKTRGGLEHMGLIAVICQSESGLVLYVLDFSLTS